MNESDQDERLEKLQSALNIIKNKEKQQDKINQHNTKDQASASVGIRAGAELIASIAAGALLGYWLDEWLETKPFFLIILLLLGVLTGFVNVWRVINDIGHQVGYKDFEQSKTNSKDDSKDGNGST